MAVSQTTRLGVYRWSSNDDSFTRSQMTDSHQNLEDLVALFTSGLFSARPAAAASNARGFYLATDTNVLFYSNGTAWFSVNSFASPVAIVPGDIVTDGTSTFAARADHKHSLPAWGVVGNLQPVGTTTSQGSNDTFARIDHRHILDGGSVTAGKIAAGAINAANLFTNGVVESAKIADGAIDKQRLAPDQQIPSGTIWAYGGTTAPTGWVFCDGTSYATSAQAALHAAIGYRYGGTGANFNVPDLRNRVARGAAATGDAVTTTSTDDVTIAANNLPTHNHSVGTLAVSNHDDHVHSQGGTISTNNLGTHTHTLVHQHTGFLDSGATVSSGAFGAYYIPVGDGPFSMFSGGSGPQADLGTSSVNNGAITTTFTNNTTTSASPSLSHNHTISGSTGNNTTALTHSVSGSTGNNTTTATALTVVPRHQTVNYIIKT